MGVQKFGLIYILYYIVILGSADKTNLTSFLFLGLFYCTKKELFFLNYGHQMKLKIGVYLERVARLLSKFIDLGSPTLVNKREIKEQPSRADWGVETNKKNIKMNIVSLVSKQRVRKKREQKNQKNKKKNHNLGERIGG